MRIGDEALRGFALAAAAVGDRGAKRAMAGLSPHAEHLACMAQALARQSRDERDATLRQWAGAATALAERAPPCSEHPRALALLAGHVPQALGKELLANAPPPRAGFVPEPGLLRVLISTWKALT